MSFERKMLRKMLKSKFNKHGKRTFAEEWHEWQRFRRQNKGEK